MRRGKIQRRPRKNFSFSGIQNGSKINCANEYVGMKKLKVIGNKGRACSKRRSLPKAFIGDKFSSLSTSHNMKYKKSRKIALMYGKTAAKKPRILLSRKNILSGILVRQKRPFRRTNGQWIYFEDNAGVILNQNGHVLGNNIKEPIMKEVKVNFPKLSGCYLEKGGGYNQLDAFSVPKFV